MGTTIAKARHNPPVASSRAEKSALAGGFSAFAATEAHLFLWLSGKARRLARCATRRLVINSTKWVNVPRPRAAPCVPRRERQAKAPTLSGEPLRGGESCASALGGPWASSPQTQACRRSATARRWALRPRSRSAWAGREACVCCRCAREVAPCSAAPAQVLLRLQGGRRGGPPLGGTCGQSRNRSHAAKRAQA